MVDSFPGWRRLPGRLLLVICSSQDTESLFCAQDQFLTLAPSENAEKRNGTGRAVIFRQGSYTAYSPSVIEHLADHITRFSLAGIRAMSGR